jgi:diguanylate cyclase (GGDEF)-like protein
MTATSEPNVSASRTEISREMTSSFDQRIAELLSDRVELQRDVILWQRWVRYATVVVLSGIALLFGASPPARVWIPLGASVAIYVLLNILAASLVSRSSIDQRRDWLPDVVLVGDVAVIAALIYLSAPPSQAYRVLLLGVLVLQLAVFYFGRRAGLIAGGLTLLAYITLSLLVPPFVDGPRPVQPVVAFNASLFAFVAAVLVTTFGTFRERMNRFRQVWKRAELGDLGGALDTDGDRFPDDLTLLGRSFNEMRGRLIELIGTDPLTGCLNRRAMETRLNREWRQAKRRGSTIALLAIDLDYFKQINDTYGHPAGDVVLQTLGEIMKTTARETDSVARMGGDEFMVLLPDTGWQGAMTFAERLRRNVHEHAFVADDRRLEITISVGVALARGTDPVSAEDLLEAADRSLYKAKSGGRNRISA